MSSYVHFLLKGFLRLLTIHRLFTWPQTRVGNLASLGSHVACHFGASQVLPPSQFRGYALSVHLRPCTETHASVFGNAVQTGCWRSHPRHCHFKAGAGRLLFYSEIVWLYQFIFNAIFDMQILVRHLKSFSFFFLFFLSNKHQVNSYNMLILCQAGLFVVAGQGWQSSSFIGQELRLAGWEGQSAHNPVCLSAPGTCWMCRDENPSLNLVVWSISVEFFAVS